jgi:formylmethanofuran:tetrahydromethanopterin formyltransferase
MKNYLGEKRLWKCVIYESFDKYVENEETMIEIDDEITSSEGKAIAASTKEEAKVVDTTTTTTTDELKNKVKIPIDGSKIPRRTEATKKARIAWKDDCIQCLAIVNKTISPQLRHYVVDKKTPYEVWQILELKVKNQSSASITRMKTKFNLTRMKEDETPLE